VVETGEDEEGAALSLRLVLLVRVGCVWQKRMTKLIALANTAIALHDNPSDDNLVHEV
jgi:hypothetical protein